MWIPKLQKKSTTMSCLSREGSEWWYDHPFEPIKYVPLPPSFTLQNAILFTRSGLHTPIYIVLALKNTIFESHYLIWIIHSVLSYFIKLSQRTKGVPGAILKYSASSLSFTSLMLEAFWSGSNLKYSTIFYIWGWRWLNHSSSTCLNYLS